MMRTCIASTRDNENDATAPSFNKRRSSLVRKMIVPNAEGKMKIAAPFLSAVLLYVLNGCNCQEEPLNQNYFPDDFLFGVASSAYQIEGAWLVDGKGENIWDRFTRENPDRIWDGSNGNIACDSYHKYREDVQLVKSLGVKFYRFSLSWSRIMPTGFTNVINPYGIAYYNNLINELLANDITPMITLYHWDLPQPLQDIGGWPNPLLADIFLDFAHLAFVEFGDRVKHWITLNEPKQICKLGYGDGILAPDMRSGGLGEYMCTYTALIAHAKAYHLYNNTYRSHQNGIIGITVDSYGFIPGSNSSEDEEAALRMFQFYTGIYTNPIFGTGDYPQVVKDFVEDRSRRQGFSSTRLPPLSNEEVALLHGTSDFFGLNFYTAIMVDDVPEVDLLTVSLDSDARIHAWSDPEWPTGASTWLKVVPSGIRRALNQIKELYDDVPIYITENGYSDYGGLQDYNRVNYFLTYLSACLEAMYEDDVNLVAYTAWTLMDNFEWIAGYVQRFGLHEVDFNDPERPRTPKLSAEYYTNIVRDRQLPATTLVQPSTTTNIPTATDPITASPTTTDSSTDSTTTVSTTTDSTTTVTTTTDSTTTEPAFAFTFKPIGFISLMILTVTMKLFSCLIVM